MARRREAGFVGRQWAIARIVDWLNSDSPSLVVAGPAGTGKTALVMAAASPQHEADSPARFQAFHLCQAHVSASTEPIRVLADLARQLGRSVPGYHVEHARSARHPPASDASPAQAAARAVLDSSGPSMAFDRALSIPLEVMAARGQRNARPGDDPGRTGVVVVIDGLDE